MKNLVATAVLTMVAAMAAPLAQAAYVDLNTFSALSGADGRVSVESNLATLSGVAGLSGRVEKLASFDWIFVDSTSKDGIASVLLTPTGGTTSLVTLAADTTRSFQTYMFSTPFSGVMKFSLDSHDASTQATLLVTNVVSAVPEPSSYALLLAGMGLIGMLGVRKSGRAGRMSAQDGQSFTTSTPTAA